MRRDLILLARYLVVGRAVVVMAQSGADRDAGEARAAQRALDARGRAPAADVIGGGVAEILRGAPGDLLDPEVPAAAPAHRLIVAENARTAARSLRPPFDTSAGMNGHR